jgi:hypothetical protein
LRRTPDDDIPIPVFGSVVQQNRGLFFIAFSILLLIMICGSLLIGSLAARPTGDLVGLGVSVVFSTVIGMTVLNLFADIAVRDSGLEVRYFLIAWVFVPWENVIAATPSLADITGKAYLVKVRRLTFVHSLIGSTQGSFHPGFLVGRGIERQRELLQIILEHIDGETRSSAHSSP